MGRCPNHKNSHGKHYSHKTARRSKFLVKDVGSRDDLIHAELKKEEPKNQAPDPDLPGMGQFYCLHCDRYFSNAAIRNDHYKTKKHKKRVKMMDGAAPHTQTDADMAAGMGSPDNGIQLRGGGIAMAI